MIYQDYGMFIYHDFWKHGNMPGNFKQTSGTCWRLAMISGWPFLVPFLWLGFGRRAAEIPVEAAGSGARGLEAESKATAVFDHVWLMISGWPSGFFSTLTVDHDPKRSWSKVPHLGARRGYFLIMTWETLLWFVTPGAFLFRDLLTFHIMYDTSSDSTH